MIGILPKTELPENGVAAVNYAVAVTASRGVVINRESPKSDTAYR